MTYPAREKTGFTLIEVLTVISIIGILAVAALPVYAHIRQNTLRQNTVEEIGATLQLARSNAVTSRDGLGWGVHFDSTAGTYTLYSGTWPTPASTIPRDVDDAITLPDATVPFDRLHGTATATQLTITGNGVTRRITITTAGTVTVE